MPSVHSSFVKWGTLLSASIACFVAFIDFAIVNTALPAIQKELSASVLELQWMMNAFVLAVSVLMVTMGRLADLFGRRLLNIIGILIFGLFSLLAGMAFNPVFLILCRLMQGVSTAVIIPSSLALISHAFPDNEKGKAVGFWSAITGVGLAIGPVLGGFIVSGLNWHWIFYINIPFVLASLILNFLVVRESHDESAEKKIDWRGCFFITVGISALVVGLIQAPDWGWASFAAITFFAIAAIAFICFYFSEKKSHYPILPPQLFANKTFASCAVALFCMVFFIWAAFFLMPLYLQNIRKEEPYMVGLMLLPITATLAILSPVAGHGGDVLSPKKLILFGLLCLVLAALGQGFFQPQSSLWLVLGSFIAMGIAWAFVTNPAVAKGIGSMPHHLSGTATGVLWTVQNIGGAIGLALTGTIFRSIYQPHHSVTSFLSGYHSAMWLLVAVSLATFITVALLMKKTQ